MESTQETIPKGLQPEVTCLGDSGGSPVGTSSKLAPCGTVPVSPHRCLESLKLPSSAGSGKECCQLSDRWLDSPTVLGIGGCQW